MSTSDLTFIESQSDRALVSFILLAYNQEQFIREAVEGAFSQTYSPLEIILSDDCSTDNTYQIIQEMAASYPGPHKVIVRQNETNQGIGFHFNKVMAATSGEFIVVAAGDDISLPERTEVMFQEWNKLGRPISSMGSGAIIFDEKGLDCGFWKELQLASNLLGLLNIEISGSVHGAAHCFHRRVFTDFGEFSNKLIAEDVAMSARALQKDGLVEIKQNLVRWRKHSNNISDLPVCNLSYRKFRERIRWQSYSQALLYKQILCDLESALKSTESQAGDDLKKARQILCDRVRYNKARSKVFTRSPYSKIRGLASLLLPPINLRNILLLAYQAFIPSPRLLRKSISQLLAARVRRSD